MHSYYNIGLLSIARVHWSCIDNSRSVIKVPFVCVLVCMIKKSTRCASYAISTHEQQLQAAQKDGKKFKVNEVITVVKAIFSPKEDSSLNMGIFW